MAALQTSERLLEFFRREFQDEQQHGFHRLSRIPSTFLIAELSHYRALSRAEQLSFIDCSAHWAHRLYGFVVEAPEFDHTQHPYYREWSHALGAHYGSTRRSVPLHRATVQQYKIDAYKGVESSISSAEFQNASAVLERCVRAPDLRKLVRTALRPLGYYKQDHWGYWCRQCGREFCVHVSFGGARGRHQLAYGVARPEFGNKPAFTFESSLGFVMGNEWDFIVKENVDECLSLLVDLVRYAYALPDRIKAEAA